MRLRHQPLEVVDESLATVLGVLVVPSDVDRFLRTHLLAVAAEDAAELVDLEDQRITVPLLVLARHELDAVRRTYRGTEAAGHTLGLAVLRGEHAVRATPPRRERPFLLRVLNRDLFLEHVLQGQGHPLQRRPQIARLRDGTLRSE